MVHLSLENFNSYFSIKIYEFLVLKYMKQKRKTWSSVGPSVYIGSALSYILIYKSYTIITTIFIKDYLFYLLLLVASCFAFFFFLLRFFAFFCSLFVSLSFLFVVVVISNASPNGIKKLEPVFSWS